MNRTHDDFIAVLKLDLGQRPDAHLIRISRWNSECTCDLERIRIEG